MVDLYNRIHETRCEFDNLADQVALLDGDARRVVLHAFDEEWRAFELAFGGIDGFRMADRSRRTRFLLDLIAAQEHRRKSGSEQAASGAELLTLILRGVKYATRNEVAMMVERVDRLRGSTSVSPAPRPDEVSRTPVTVH